MELTPAIEPAFGDVGCLDTGEHAAQRPFDPAVAVHGELDLRIALGLLEPRRDEFEECRPRGFGVLG
jgi:hypothetical protein